MSRLMSVALTEAAVRDRSKSVTRRLGWTFARVGDRITLSPKVMGRKAGEPLVRICDVRPVNVRREPLAAITEADVAREGFAGMTPAAFVEFFCKHMKCTPETWVTRLEWRYLDGGESS